MNPPSNYFPNRSPVSYTNSLSKSSTPTFLQIAQHGTYYYPAHTHYSISVDRPKNVRCDRCNKTHLMACIGYGEYDLCLTCCEKVVSTCNIPLAPIPHYIPSCPYDHGYPLYNSNSVQPSSYDNLTPDHVRPIGRTSRMNSEMYRSDNTFMMSDMYKK